MGRKFGQMNMYVDVLARRRRATLTWGTEKAGVRQ